MGDGATSVPSRSAIGNAAPPHGETRGCVRESRGSQTSGFMATHGWKFAGPI
jgi:hypothetical protein